VKIFKEKATQTLAKITAKLGKNWNSFLSKVTKETEADDGKLIRLERFIELLREYHL
jgi:hypothetical protein